MCPCRDSVEVARSRNECLPVVFGAGFEPEICRFSSQLQYDPLREGVEERHGERCFSMRGAEDHSLGDQRVAKGRHRGDVPLEDVGDITRGITGGLN